MGRKPLLSAQQVTYARKLLDQRAHPRDVAHVLKGLWRTIERALAAAK